MVVILNGLRQLTAMMRAVISVARKSERALTTSMLNETLWYVIIISSMAWIILAIELTLYFDEQIFMLVVTMMFVHLALAFFLTSRIK